MKKSDALQRYIENQAIEWLVKLNDPNVSELDIQEFNQWLNESPARQSAYIKAEQIWGASEKLLKNTAPKSRTGVANWQYAFASFLIIICISFYQYTVNLITNYEFHTGIGEQKTVELADGSKITLNSQSNIKFSINKKIRKAHLLAGEVLFDVNPDAKRPFDVETHDGLIRVLGTKFSVNRYSGSTLVTVVEGRVALGEKPFEKDIFVPAQILSQSQQQTMTNAINGVAPLHVDVKSELAWKDHQLIVRDEKLSHVLRDLERVFPVKFVIVAPHLSEKRITAVLNLSDLEQVLLVLEASLSLQIERTPTEIRLSEKK